MMRAVPPGNDEPSLAVAPFPVDWAFLTSAADVTGLPPADTPEVAFVGRSNVGKSSLINAVVRRRNLARTSSTPGRTQLLNFFVAPRSPVMLVDLPGYGFARAPKDKVTTWTRLIFAYLRGRPTLRRVFLLIDARHGPKPIDIAAADVLDEAAVSYQPVLTKIDKVKAEALEVARIKTATCLGRRPAAFPAVLATSAQSGEGIAALRVGIMKLV